MLRRIKSLGDIEATSNRKGFQSNKENKLEKIYYLDSTGKRRGGMKRSFSLFSAGEKAISKQPIKSIYTNDVSLEKEDLQADVCIKVIAKILEFQDFIIAALREQEFTDWLEDGDGEEYLDKIDEISVTLAKLLIDHQLTEKYKDIFYGEAAGKNKGLIAGETTLLINFFKTYPFVAAFINKHLNHIEEVAKAWQLWQLKTEMVSTPVFE